MIRSAMAWWIFLSPRKYFFSSLSRENHFFLSLTTRIFLPVPHLQFTILLLPHHENIYSPAYLTNRIVLSPTTSPTTIYLLLSLSYDENNHFSLSFSTKVPSVVMLAGHYRAAVVVMTMTGIMLVLILLFWFRCRMMVALYYREKTFVPDPEGRGKFHVLIIILIIVTSVSIVIILMILLACKSSSSSSNTSSIECHCF